MTAFRQGLREPGYVEGQNVAIDTAGQNPNDRLPAMAADLVGRQVTVIATPGTVSAIVAKATTTTIPIVLATAATRLLGLVASLNRPGGNVTCVVCLIPWAWSEAAWVCCTSWCRGPALGVLVDPDYFPRPPAHLIGLSD